jgi:hypothetical protein
VQLLCLTAARRSGAARRTKINSSDPPLTPSAPRTGPRHSWRSFTHQSSWLAVDDVAVFTSIGGCNFGDLPLPRHALHVGITEILVQVSDPVRLLKESYAVGTENALAA